MLEPREEVCPGKSGKLRKRQGDEQDRLFRDDGRRRGGYRGAMPGHEKCDQTKMGRGRIGMQMLVPARRGAEQGRGDNGAGECGRDETAA